MGAFIPNQNRDRLAVHCIFNWLQTGQLKDFIPIVSALERRMFRVSDWSGNPFCEERAKRLERKARPLQGNAKKIEQNIYPSISIDRQRNPLLEIRHNLIIWLCPQLRKGSGYRCKSSLVPHCGFSAHIPHAKTQSVFSNQ